MVEGQPLIWVNPKVQEKQQKIIPCKQNLEQGSNSNSVPAL